MVNIKKEVIEADVLVMGGGIGGLIPMFGARGQ